MLYIFWLNSLNLHRGLQYRINEPLHPGAAKPQGRGLLPARDAEIKAGGKENTPDRDLAS